MVILRSNTFNERIKTNILLTNDKFKFMNAYKKNVNQQNTITTHTFSKTKVFWTDKIPTCKLLLELNFTWSIYVYEKFQNSLTQRQKYQ